MSAPMLGGGTIFSPDNRIPNGVTLENYRHHIETGRELLSRPPISKDDWVSMAL